MECTFLKNVADNLRIDAAEFDQVRERVWLEASLREGQKLCVGGVINQATLEGCTHNRYGPPDTRVDLCTKKMLLSRYKRLWPPTNEDTNILFVDGSRVGDYAAGHAGFSIVQQQQSQFRTTELEAITRPCLAQLAEIKALTAVCELIEDEKADIYTVSAYTIYVGQLEARKLHEEQRRPIQYCQQFIELATALMKPKH
ncbi:hypothetical protein chiPu_0015349 [Chiloscyllium punctatum]|uniref:RNase H type-1 domain-containing protein n=1 Tax=Chiloscyllium punctatum TaxID=137246 RepID=A0A401T2G7_CHIPU|nr:hypothetical protein [Chiloscyllium punctatum]